MFKFYNRNLCYKWVFRAKIQTYHFENLPMQKTHSAFDKTEAYQSEIEQIQIFPPFINHSQANSSKKQPSKPKETSSSMQRFYESFYKNYYDKKNQTFTIQELTQKYKVKNRRVYELIGILEGFSLMSKLKKVGTYMWLGMEKQAYTFYFEENKSVALRNVAGLLKLVLSKCRNGLTIKQLNQKIIYQIQEKIKRKQCERTIKRRIYECLKVMKIFQIVRKEKNLFRINVCKRSSQQFSAKRSQITQNGKKKQTTKSSLSLSKSEHSQFQLYQNDYSK